MNMPDRPVFLCGKCEEICTEVKAANQPLQGRTVFEVKHHGRTYRKEIDSREIESICHSNVPALDVAGWPQDTTQNERASASGSFDRGFSHSDPLLYCGKCDCRMEKRAAYLNQSNRSVDFAVCCHGDVYVLNLSEDERWRMMGQQGDNMAARATALPQRLDVCDQHGKQYPHLPPIHPDAAALEGTKISASGIIFDPAPPVAAYVPQTPDPVLATLPAPQPITPVFHTTPTRRIILED